MSIIRIGFTGSRRGMTPAQIRVLYGYLSQVALVNDRPEVTRIEGHHGDCIGSDAAFHVIAAALGFWTAAHPPSDPSRRAGCIADEIRPPKGYLARDWDIAMETGELLAAPDGPPRPHSGTWTTISYGLRLRRPVTVFYPDGATGSGRCHEPALILAGYPLGVPG